MANYTLYHCEAGRIAEITEIACDDDAAAARLAQQLYDGRAMVLWRGDHNVSSWHGQDRTIRGIEARA